MFDLDKWQEIVAALKSNKLRTFLTAFGVFWGIFMLIIMLGSGRGLENAVFEGMGDFATNSAFVWTQRTGEAYKGFNKGRSWNFTNDDMEALRSQVNEIDLLAPRIQAWGGDGANNVTRGLKTGAFNVKGDYPEYAEIDPLKMIYGRFINDRDIQENRKVAVIGNRVYEVLFEKDEDPIGKYIRVQGVYFQIVGVFEPLNKNINFGGDKQETVFLPFTSLQIAYNFGDVVHYFAVTAKGDIPVSEVQEKCHTLLKQRHSIHPDDEKAIGGFNLEEEFKKMRGLFTGISTLIWIVGIGTLLAGVIGVSNIMLIIVKERTREIGVQRALGATPFKILTQIITESVFLTALAGYVGLLIGVGLVELINYALVQSGGESEMFKNPEVDFQIAITALTVLIVFGALAGLIPAKRAVSIKPIDALRSE